MGKWRRARYRSLIVILGVFLMLAVILNVERSGISYRAREQKLDYLNSEEALTGEEVYEEVEKTALIVMDSESEDSKKALEQFERIFMDMKVGYHLVDIRKDELPDFEEYETVTVLMTELSPFKEGILDLCGWVKDGGRVLFPLTIQKDSYSTLIEQKLGIISSGYENAEVSSVYLDEAFMLGGGRSYHITDAFDSGWAVELDEKVKVHAWTDDEKKVPLIWENAYGSGKFVVVNIGLYEKVNRGFYAAAYSLLEDVCAYPVINGSTFYLDDFPSPVPSGDGTYVKRDYNTSIADFYTNIWWPDMLTLADKYGVIYTGVIIENYEDEVDGDTETATDTARFQYFGNMLLHMGGEIGYHGYNHQPLCLGNTDYGDVLPYKTWESYDAMLGAVKELETFGKEMFPTAELAVYVPPSNVLSEEGRRMLKEEFPEIKTVASNYFTGEFAYVQEFEVAEDGMVEQPRVISGAVIDDYMELAAVSELNMHFVNNHFMHPDDLLDEDRGAKLGWEKLKNRLDEYMEWLYGSAPELRSLTASELSAAIQRFAAVTVEKEITDEEIIFNLSHLYDEAYLMVRINEGKPGEVSGGTLTHMTGNLYLLKAESDQVRIQRMED